MFSITFVIEISIALKSGSGSSFLAFKAFTFAFNSAYYAAVSLTSAFGSSGFLCSESLIRSSNCFLIFGKTNLT